MGRSVSHTLYEIMCLICQIASLEFILILSKNLKITNVFCLKLFGGRMQKLIIFTAIF